MKVCILYSGAKDSNYALYLAKKMGHDIPCLVTFMSNNPESYMFHTPNIKWVKIQAKAIEIPIEIFKTEGIKELELKDIENALKKIKKKYKIEGVVSGAIESDYQRKRIKKICESLDLKSINPLWKLNPEKYMKELVDSGFKIKIVGVYAEGLTKDWLGKSLNKDTFDKLKKLNQKYKVHMAGEGGEYETFVCDGPIFKKRIKILRALKKWKNNSGHLDIQEVKLIKK